MSDRIACSVIDIVNKKRISAQLLDSDGKEVDLADTVKVLLDVLKSKLSYQGAKNKADTMGETIRNEVLPVVSAATITSLEEYLGHELATMLLSDRIFKTVMIRLTLTGYALHSLVQQNDFRVRTRAEPITDDEIGQVLKLEELSDIISKAATSGLNPKDVVAELIRRSLITENDLRAYGLDDETVETLTSLSKQPGSKEGDNLN